MHAHKWFSCLNIIPSGLVPQQPAATGTADPLETASGRGETQRDDIANCLYGVDVSLPLLIFLLCFFFFTFHYPIPVLKSPNSHNITVSVIMK